MTTSPISIFWFRRDLRLHDNAGLYHALTSGKPVLPIFIFDTEILDKLPSKLDARVTFIHQQLASLQQKISQHGSSLLALNGKPIDVWKKLLEQFPIADVYTNHDYEPYARQRDSGIKDLLGSKGVAFHTFKDQVVFEKNEVVKDDGNPYTVFTPYSKKWRALLDSRPDGHFLKPFPSENHTYNFFATNPFALPSLADLGFQTSSISFPSTHIEDSLLAEYAEKRDIPGIKGTSRMSLHLRFGTVSIRELITKGLAHSPKWLAELIWREFYMMILWHFPHVVDRAFNPNYDHIVWRNNPKEFEAWCEGKTGYPIVDAGMRELNQTGFMHNRSRMIVASFLTKHLLIDWRWGEAYFAEKLLDFDLSANNGGWQWAAGTGCDAAPYFRVFNPYLQTEKFDPNLEYIRKWVPEFQGFGYPKPIVDHALARDRALEAYKVALGKDNKTTN